MDPVTYEYYTGQYHGDTLTEDEFAKYEHKARRYVSGFTYGNIDVVKDVPGVVRDCICDIAENIQKESSRQSGNGISSESGDGHSVSYEKSRTEAELRQQYYQIALGYLINSGYLYGGVMLCSTARNW